MMLTFGRASHINRKIKIRLVSVVWGRAYVDSLIRLAWRALLAPGNVPAIASQFDVSYVLYIHEDELPTAVASRQYQLLSQIIPIELMPFSDKAIHSNRYIGHWNAWKDAVSWARENDAVVLLVIPDVMYFDGTFVRWAEQFKAGKLAVFSIGTWVVEETFVPYLEAQYPYDSNDVVALSGEEGQRSLMEHMHPLIGASFVDSGRSLFHMDRITRGVPGQGLLSRIFTSQPMMFDPKYFQVDQNHIPLNRYDDIFFDDVTMLSTGTVLHVMEFYHAQEPFTEDYISKIVGWSHTNMGKTSHPLESQFNYRYARQGIPIDAAAWRRASDALDDDAHALLRAHAIGEIWHYIHRSLGTYPALRCCLLISLALQRYHLHRALKADGAYTVLLPIDSAFNRWDDAFLEGAFEGDPEPGIFDVIRNHVVPHRLYLTPGDCIVVHPNEDGGSQAPEPDMTTLSGRRITIARKEASTEETSGTILSPQARIGHGAVYYIDRILR